MSHLMVSLSNTLNKCCTCIRHQCKPHRLSLKHRPTLNDGSFMTSRVLMLFVFPSSTPSVPASFHLLQLLFPHSDSVSSCSRDQVTAASLFFLSYNGSLMLFLLRSLTTPTTLLLAAASLFSANQGLLRISCITDVHCVYPTVRGGEEGGGCEVGGG